MNTAVATIDHARFEVMTPAALTSRLTLVQQAMKQSMSKGKDYGTIPGTPKPSLYKAGAEKLCTLFHIAPDFHSEDLSTHDCVRIRVKCVGTHQLTGTVLGSAIGECSSDESKYKWRRPVCKEEFDETPEDRRRVKWMPGKGGKAYRSTQVRTDPADMANTVMQMAEKRALVAMVRLVTNASEIFTQDVEDIPPEVRPANVDEDGVIHDEPVRRTPQSRAGATGAISASQLQVLQRKLDDAGMPAEQLCARFGIKALPGLQFNDLNTALAYVADPQMNEAR